jgi:diguanylate cyclase (GGDEF)-like protein/PAS domain S-box-containing protein
LSIKEFMQSTRPPNARITPRITRSKILTRTDPNLAEPIEIVLTPDFVEIDLYTAFKAIPDAIIITDTNPIAPGPSIVYVNPAFERISGYTSKEVIGNNPRMLQGPKTDPETRERIRTALHAERAVLEHIVNYNPNGNPYWVEINIEPMLNEAGKLTNFVSTQRDISERKRLEDELRFRANCDALTGLPNRAQYLERLDQILAEATRYKHKLGVVMMDLDRFKSVNDMYGHATGDIVLRTIAERLKPLMRETDVVGRLGGDEFAFIMVEPNSRSETLNALQRIANALSEPIRIGKQKINITASFGLSMYPEDADNAKSLLHRADMAMYNAKATGRNNVQTFHNSIQNKAERQNSLERRLRQAVKNEEFELYFQPIHESSGRLVSFEALLRWNDAKFGTVAPDVFIPLAEKTGLLHQLDLWVLREATRCATIMHAQNPNLKMSVNISPSAFNQARLIEDVEEALEASGFPANCLRLEITEQAMIADYDMCAAHLNQLRALGIEVAIDDFGAGYSNLKHLVALPMDVVKIDRFFVTGFEKDTRAQMLVKGVIELAHQLGYKVVGEGVETEAERQMLFRLGCDQVQGYWLAHPMPFEKTGVHIQQHLAA